MPEKQKSSHNWKDPKTVIAVVSVTGLLTLWNSFATHDRQQMGAPDRAFPNLSEVSEADLDGPCRLSDPRLYVGAKCVSITQTRSS